MLNTPVSTSLAFGTLGHNLQQLVSTHQSWAELADGIRPEQIAWDVEREPGMPRHGWQRTATIPVHGQ